MSQLHITTNHTLTNLKEVLDLLNFGTREAILVIKVHYFSTYAARKSNYMPIKMFTFCKCISLDVLNLNYVCIVAMFIVGVS